MLTVLFVVLSGRLEVLLTVLFVLVSVRPELLFVLVLGRLELMLTVLFVVLPGRPELLLKVLLVPVLTGLVLLVPLLILLLLPEFDDPRRLGIGIRLTLEALVLFELPRLALLEKRFKLLGEGEICPLELELVPLLAGLTKRPFVRELMRFEGAGLGRWLLILRLLLGATAISLSLYSIQPETPL